MGGHFLTYAFILDSSQSAMNEVSGIPRRSWWSTAFRFDSADNRDSFQPNHNLHFSTQPLFVFSTQYIIGFSWPKKAKRFVTTLKTDSKMSQIWIIASYHLCSVTTNLNSGWRVMSIMSLRDLEWWTAHVYHMFIDSCIERGVLQECNHFSCVQRPRENSLHFHAWSTWCLY